jgi:hemolysin activation/secretion protein
MTIRNSCFAKILLSNIAFLSPNLIWANGIDSIMHTSNNHNMSSDVYNGGKQIHKNYIKKAKSFVPQNINKISFNPFEIKEVQLYLNNNVDEKAKEYFKSYNDKYVDSKEMNNLIKEITHYYIDQGFLLPKLKISKKALAQHKIEINVVTASLDDVIIVGEGENNSLIQAYAAKILNSSPAMTKNVQRYLALMNDIPGIEAYYNLKENKDKIELVIYTLKKKWSAYAGVDSYGTSNLGQYQASALIQSYSPFNKNESIVLHGSMTNRPDRFNDIGISTSFILGTEGTKLNLSSSFSHDNPTKKDTVEAKTNQGKNFRLSATHHLIINADTDLEAEAGFIHKNIKTNQVVNNQSVSSKESKFWMGDIGLKYLIKDMIGGKDMFTIAYIKGLSGTFKNYLDNPNKIDKNFSIVRFNFFREQPLPNNFEVSNHLSLSSSNNNLPDSEKAILGGRDFGRGYGFAVLDGSKLAALSTELRYNKNLNAECLVNHIQPYIFHDVGHLSKQDEGTNISKLESAGLGVRFKTKHKFNLGIEAAFPFKKNYVVDGTSYKASTNYSFFINKIVEF